MVAVNPKIFVTTILGGLIAMSCSGSGGKLPAIEVQPKGSSFAVTVGQEVDWTFSAKRSGRDIDIIDVASARLPFGVKPVYEPGKFGFKGKVLGRQFRGGLIQVIAFDKKACEQGYADMKKMVEKNMRETNQSEATIPLEPCKPSTAMSDPAMEQYISKAQFYWNMTDGVDELKPEMYRQVAVALSCEASGTCAASEQFYAADQSAKAKPKKNLARNLFVVIPGNQTPPSVDVVLGECARFERRECGQDKSCLWGRGSCISASAAAPKKKEGERQ
jgi:hypothetical protein